MWVSKTSLNISDVGMRQLVVQVRHFIQFGDYDCFRVPGMKQKVVDCLSQLEADMPEAEPSPE